MKWLLKQSQYMQEPFKFRIFLQNSLQNSVGAKYKKVIFLHETIDIKVQGSFIRHILICYNVFFHRWMTLWEERLCKKMAAFLYLLKSWLADVWVALFFKTQTYNPYIMQWQYTDNKEFSFECQWALRSKPWPEGTLLSFCEVIEKTLQPHQCLKNMHKTLLSCHLTSKS